MARNAPPNGTATQFKSGEKAAESGRKGGIASGKAKREKKDNVANGCADDGVGADREKQGCD